MAMHTELLLLLLSISLTFLCSLTTKCTPLLVVDARDFIIATWRVDEEKKLLLKNFLLTQCTLWLVDAFISRAFQQKYKVNQVDSHD